MTISEQQRRDFEEAYGVHPVIAQQIRRDMDRHAAAGTLASEEVLDAMTAAAVEHAEQTGDVLGLLTSAGYDGVQEYLLHTVGKPIARKEDGTADPVPALSGDAGMQVLKDFLARRQAAAGAQNG